jgi:hypothetical protein
LHRSDYREENGLVSINTEKHLELLPPGKLCFLALEPSGCESSIYFTWSTSTSLLLIPFPREEMKTLLFILLEHEQKDPFLFLKKCFI